MVAKDVFGIKLFPCGIEGRDRIAFSHAFPQESFVFRCQINHLDLGPMINSFVLGHQLLVTKLDVFPEPAAINKPS